MYLDCSIALDSYRMLGDEHQVDTLQHDNCIGISHEVSENGRSWLVTGS